MYTFISLPSQRARGIFLKSDSDTDEIYVWLILKGTNLERCLASSGLKQIFGILDLNLTLYVHVTHGDNTSGERFIPSLNIRLSFTPRAGLSHPLDNVSCEELQSVLLDYSKELASGHRFTLAVNWTFPAVSRPSLASRLQMCIPPLHKVLHLLFGPCNALKIIWTWRGADTGRRNDSMLTVTNLITVNNCPSFCLRLISQLRAVEPRPCSGLH